VFVVRKREETMIQKSFYPIASTPKEEEKYFLFGRRSSSGPQDEKTIRRNRNPEEGVRQWAIYELLSVYGIRISSINIERSARDHSKHYPPDIVVNQNDKPYIVVECKRPYRNNPNKALEQAQIYADDLKAEFAVYTDANSWKVTRKMGDSWIPVDNIPKNADVRADDTITDALEFLEDLKPLLYWLYREVPGPYTHTFMTLMQELVGAHIFGLEDYDLNLANGTDFLLRVITGCLSKKELTNRVGEYEEKKMRAAFMNFHKYFKNTGYPSFLDGFEFTETIQIREFVAPLLEGFDEFIKGHKNLAYSNANLARFAFALLQYLSEILEASYHKSEHHRNVPSSLVNEFGRFIEPILVSKIHLRLPGPLDAEIKSLRNITCKTWVSNEGKMP
jgi:hypothetical protein